MKPIFATGEKVVWTSPEGNKFPAKVELSTIENGRIWISVGASQSVKWVPISELSKIE